MKQKGNIISLFLSCIYNDIIKRTKKTFTYSTLNEVTNLPLIFCEKSCLYISPITGELNVHNFTILIKNYSITLILIHDSLSYYKSSTFPIRKS